METGYLGDKVVKVIKVKAIIGHYGFPIPKKSFTIFYENCLY